MVRSGRPYIRIYLHNWELYCILNLCRCLCMSRWNHQRDFLPLICCFICILIYSSPPNLNLTVKLTGNQKGRTHRRLMLRPAWLQLQIIKLLLLDTFWCRRFCFKNQPKSSAFIWLVTWMKCWVTACYRALRAWMGKILRYLSKNLFSS